MNRKRSRRPPELRLQLDSDEMIIDNFAGGGGASSGLEMAFGRSPDIAVNHDPEAIAMHTANHPRTRHFVEDVYDVDIAKVVGKRKVGCAWFSPDCCYHSRARGGKPFRDRNRARRIRGLAWVVIKWAKAVKPRVILLENVSEFAEWGPLDADGKVCPLRKGFTFRRWKAQLENLGYVVEMRELKACDFGAPTSRKRLFIVARCDGRPIVWPEPTHFDPEDIGEQVRGNGKKRPSNDGAARRGSAARGRGERACVCALVEDANKATGVSDSQRVPQNLHHDAGQGPHGDGSQDRMDLAVRSPAVRRGDKSQGRGQVEQPNIQSRGPDSGAKQCPRQGAGALVAGMRDEERDRQALRGGRGGSSFDEGQRPSHCGDCGGIRDQRGVHATRSGGNGKKPWLTAASCIDWSIPCKSIFGRKKPLAENTLRRIAKGIWKYVINSGSPFIVPVTHPKDARVHGLDEPVRTVTAANRGELALVAPVLIQTSYGERQGQAPRVLNLHTPLGTVVAGGVKHSLVTAFLAKHYSERKEGGWNGGAPLETPISTVTVRDHHALVTSHLLKLYGTAEAGAPLTEPMPTVTATGWHLAEVRAFLIKFFGTDQDPRLEHPLHTITTKDRFGLILVTIGGEQYAIVDIQMRMLAPHELAAAQGFKRGYVLNPKVPNKQGKLKALSRTAQVRMIGNSVSPPMAAALARAQFLGTPAEQLNLHGVG